jgi:hypothetical protein
MFWDNIARCCRQMCGHMGIFERVPERLQSNPGISHLSTTTTTPQGGPNTSRGPQHLKGGPVPQGGLKGAPTPQGGPNASRGPHTMPRNSSTGPKSSMGMGNLANSRELTQTHANSRKLTQTHANSRKLTQTHANSRKPLLGIGPKGPKPSHHIWTFILFLRTY